MDLLIVWFFVLFTKLVSHCIFLLFLNIKATNAGKDLLTLEDTKGPKKVVVISPLSKVKNTCVIGMNVEFTNEATLKE